MSKYAALASRLSSLKADLWVANFDEIEAILGFPLPRSAYAYPAWWANQNTPGHSQNFGWKSVGWKTEGLDLNRRRVTFRKDSDGLNAVESVGVAGDSAKVGLSITEAKIGLSRRYGVAPENIEITIRG